MSFRVESVVNLIDDENTPDNTHTKTLAETSHKRMFNDEVGIIETIDLDDLPSSQTSENNNIIDITDDYQNGKIIRNPFVTQHHENKYLAKFIEECLHLENSKGMLRVINKTLLGIYKEMDEEYKMSHKFERLLLYATKSIKKFPDRKFSHLKNLCETMKQHKVKKRVQLTTLGTNLANCDTTFGTKRPSDEFDSIQKKQKVNLIIDSDEEENMPVINIDEYQSDMEVIELDSTQNDAEKENRNNLNSEEEHRERTEDREELQVKEARNINSQNKEEVLLVPQLEVSWKQNIINTNNKPINRPINTNNTPININSEDLIIIKSPERIELPIEFVPSAQEKDPQVEKETRIKELEQKIASCNRMIKECDEAEVEDDTAASPYIRSERLKRIVVQLYEELCQLTGHTAVKHRKVRLQIIEGHPEGPVRKLEKFLNDNIRSDGEPPFPDFCDVVQCVIASNVEDNLMWSKQQIMTEATSLFVHCGRALQRRRQKREYEDLLYQVKQEQRDPADEDPELLARLESNRILAEKNETDLIEKYAKLETTQKLAVVARTLQNGRDHQNTIIGHIEPTLGNISSNIEPTLSNTLSNIEPTLSNTSSNIEPTLSNTSSKIEPTLSNTSSNIEPTLASLSNTVPLSNLSNNNGPTLYISSNIGPALSNTSSNIEPTWSNTSSNIEPTLSHTSSNIEPTLASLSNTVPLSNLSNNNGPTLYISSNIGPALSNTSSNIEPTLSNTSSNIEPTLSNTSSNIEPTLSNTSSNIEPTLASLSNTVPLSNLSNNNGPTLYISSNIGPALSNTSSNIEPTLSNTSRNIELTLSNTSSNIEHTLSNTLSNIGPTLDITSSKVGRTLCNTLDISPTYTEYSGNSPTYTSSKNSLLSESKKSMSDTCLKDESESMKTSLCNFPYSEENSTIEEKEIIIKQEPEEVIIKKLEDLGDDYIVSIYDVEDPFVVVEISSDSSDDENGD